MSGWSGQSAGPTVAGTSVGRRDAAAVPVTERNPREPRRSGRPQRGRPAGPRGAGPPRGPPGPCRGRRSSTRPVWPHWSC